MKYKWVKIADSRSEFNLENGQLTEIEVEGRNICLSKYGGVLYACSQKCPHAGGIMAEGFIDATGNIVCPHHRYKFSLKNGRNVSGEGYFLKIFPVEQREEGIFIGFQENNFFNWLK